MKRMNLTDNCPKQKIRICNCMKRKLKNIISVLYSFIYFFITKIFNWKNFKFSCIERFSPSTEVTIANKGKISLGKRITAHSGTRLKVVSSGNLVIEDHVRFNYGCIVVSQGSIKIKRGVGFGPNVQLFDHDHDYKNSHGVGPGATKFKKGSIEIGENSWIGANAVILRNTKLGKNCVVAAGSVIGNCEYPDNTVIYQKRDTQTKSFTLIK